MAGEKRTTKYAKGAKRGAKLLFKDEPNRVFKNEHQALAKAKISSKLQAQSS